MKFQKNQYLRLYSNVIPTRGYNRSSLTDLYYNKCHFVPNGLIDFIFEYNFEKEDIYSFLNKHEDDSKKILFEYIDFITSNNLGLLSDKETIENFTPLPLNYYPNSEIKNAIFEFDNKSEWNIKNTLEQLNDCGTIYLEIRFLDYKSFEQNVINIKDYLFTNSIESVHILVPFDIQLKEFINKNLYDFNRLNRITVYDANSGFELDIKFIKIYFSSQKSIDNNHCGNVSSEYFSISTPAYINNKNNNNCLAFKLSIDKDGQIKNCPSYNQSYGDINNKSISEILFKTNFKELWNVTKDKISICSDCEFRWICTDCRVFTKSSESLYSKPSKCNYNPYIGLWKGEENYLTEEECGINEIDSKLIIDHEQLEIINNRIWG